MKTVKEPAGDPADAAAYRQALDWLFTRTRAGAPRTPARMTRLAGALGLVPPPRTVHVAGTNGKGTVSAMIQAGLSAAGHRSGLFISPHVEEFRERISVDGRQVTQAEVTASVARLKERQLPPAAFFELVLALALEHFAAERVDWAVIEAGVGARNDATLAVGNTVLSVLTQVAVDHAGTLGTSLAEITADKAAVIRPGIPVVTMVGGVPLQVVRGAAERQGSRLVHPETDAELFRVPEGSAAAGTRYSNQQLAAAALRLLNVPEPHVLTGISRPPLPGRGERFVISGRTVLLDGAHDPAAARALRSGLAPGYTLLYGGQDRKQQTATLNELAAAASRTITVPVAGSHPPDGPGITACGSAAAGLELALQATPPGGLLVIAGSLYLAGELRPLLSEAAQNSL